MIDSKTDKYLRNIAKDLPKIKTSPDTVLYKKNVLGCMLPKARKEALKKDDNFDPKARYHYTEVIEHTHDHFKHLLKAWGKGGDAGNRAVIEYCISAKNMAANLNRVTDAVKDGTLK